MADPDSLKSDHDARRAGEDDAPVDTGVSHSRDSGGSEMEGTQDQTSSTGTTPNDVMVGRASGDETADTGESGGERRAGRGGDGDVHEGALRDE
jgi:hypothetical protein